MEYLNTQNKYISNVALHMYGQQYTGANSIVYSRKLTCDLFLNSNVMIIIIPSVNVNSFTKHIVHVWALCHPHCFISWSFPLNKGFRFITTNIYYLASTCACAEFIVWQLKLYINGAKIRVHHIIKMQKEIGYILQLD